MKTKVCKKCKIDKPLAQYHKNANCPDNHMYECKVCVNTRIAAHKAEKKKEREMWGLI